MKEDDNQYAVTYHFTNLKNSVADIFPFSYFQNKSIHHLLVFLDSSYWSIFQIFFIH